MGNFLTEQCIASPFLQAFSTHVLGRLTQNFGRKRRWVLFLFNLLIEPSNLLQKEFGPVIGISKQSCPVCSQLLTLLRGYNATLFLIRGSHNTVTPCTLPAWFPSDIVDSMNQFFGGELRRELVELMDRSPIIRKRKESTGSHRLSSDNNNGENDTHVDLSEVISQTGVKQKSKGKV